MTKKEVIWLLIRLAGLWFLWEFIANGITLLTTYAHASQDEQLLARSAAVFMQLIIQIGVYLGLGIYCVRFGDLFFDVLNREDPDAGDSDSSHPTTLGI